MNNENLEEIIFELYKKTATELPEDVLKSLNEASNNEDGISKKIIEEIVKNCNIAKENSVPICQDTGTPIFYIEYGEKYKEKEMKNAIKNATKRATKEVPLRPNAVDSLNGQNSGDNIGGFFPIIYFDQKDLNGTKISLLLKGGGSENVGKRYSLPNNSLNAGRDLEGVRKCILDAIYQAQGKGCAPGVVSACIGGSKDAIAFYAKKQLCEKLSRKNPTPELEKLEKQIIREANSLGIGAMGLGGKTTVLDVKICSTHRHPASYFVEIAYSCWALRRNTINIFPEGEVNYE